MDSPVPDLSSNPLPGNPDERKDEVLRRIIAAIQGGQDAHWSVRRFAEIAGVSRATLYNYFDSLSGIYRAVSASLMAKSGVMMEAQEGLGDEERIALWIDRWMGWIQENRTLVVITLRSHGDIEDYDSPLRTARRGIAFGLAQKHLKVSDPSNELIFELVCAVVGAEDAVRQWLVLEKASEEQVRRVFSSFLRGILRIAN